MKYLFICNGNVARSQEAEIFFDATKNSQTNTAQSAGVNVTIGKPIDPKVIEVMREIGYEMPDAVCKFVTEDMANRQIKSYLLSHLRSCPNTYGRAKQILSSGMCRIRAINQSSPIGKYETTSSYVSQD